MSDSFVQVAPDSSGKLIDNTTVATQAGSVYRQTVSIGDGGGADRAPVDRVAGLSVTSDEFWKMSLLMRQSLLVQANGPHGFVPYETPTIGA